MSALHTPGPWQSMHDYDRSGDFTIIGNVDGEIIDGHTHHSYTTVAEVYDNDNLAEDRANARLIAAAPDLLNALQPLVALLDWYSPEVREDVLVAGNADGLGRPRRLTVGHLRAAKAAIAKARGEA